MSPAGVGLGGLARYQNPTRCAAGRMMESAEGLGENSFVFRLAKASSLQKTKYS